MHIYVAIVGTVISASCLLPLQLLECYLALEFDPAHIFGIMQTCSNTCQDQQSSKTRGCLIFQYHERERISNSNAFSMAMHSAWVHRTHMDPRRCVVRLCIHLKSVHKLKGAWYKLQASFIGRCSYSSSSRVQRVVARCKSGLYPTYIQTTQTTWHGTEQTVLALVTAPQCFRNIFILPQV